MKGVPIAFGYYAIPYPSCPKEAGLPLIPVPAGVQGQWQRRLCQVMGEGRRLVHAPEKGNILPSVHALPALASTFALPKLPRLFVTRRHFSAFRC